MRRRVRGFARLVSAAQKKIPPSFRRKSPFSAFFSPLRRPQVFLKNFSSRLPIL
jgi:hypothetical protein